MNKRNSDIISINTSYEDGVLLDAGLEFALQTVEELQQLLIQNFKNNNELFADIDIRTLPNTQNVRDGLILACRSIQGMWTNTRQNMPMAILTCNHTLPDKTILRLGSDNPNDKWKEITPIDPQTAANLVLQHFIEFHNRINKGDPNG